MNNKKETFKGINLLKKISLFLFLIFQFFMFMFHSVVFYKLDYQSWVIMVFLVVIAFWIFVISIALYDFIREDD